MSKLQGQSCRFAQIWAAEHRHSTAFGFHEAAVACILRNPVGVMPHSATIISAE
jgi:hypothetical protein